MIFAVSKLQHSSSKHVRKINTQLTAKANGGFNALIYLALFSLHLQWHLSHAELDGLLENPCSPWHYDTIHIVSEVIPASPQDKLRRFHFPLSEKWSNLMDFPNSILRSILSITWVRIWGKKLHRITLSHTLCTEGIDIYGPVDNIYASNTYTALTHISSLQSADILLIMFLCWNCTPEGDAAGDSLLIFTGGLFLASHLPEVSTFTSHPNHDAIYGLTFFLSLFAWHIAYYVMKEI